MSILIFGIPTVNRLLRHYESLLYTHIMNSSRLIFKPQATSGCLSATYQDKRMLVVLNINYHMLYAYIGML